MRFQFIHAADLHIDSPLHALGAKDAAIAATFKTAGRLAVERLVAETIRSDAKFLLVAGDVFDDDWQDYATGQFFAKELGKLDRAGIRTFLIRGNHDAANHMSRQLPYPTGVQTFDARRGHTLTLDDLNVALHGRSFPERAVPADFVESYPAARRGWLNIGLLHTSLDGAADHKPYAPCSVADLARFGYDYWALGHIHARAVVAEYPWVVFPGNLQGRSSRETGPKGAVRVTVEDGRVVDVEPIWLDAARWAHERVDLTGLTQDEAILEAVAASLATAHRGADGRPLAIRLTLAGATAAHARLVARLAGLDSPLRAEAQALAHRHADDFWIEKIRLETREVRARAPSGADALDLAGLLAEAAADPLLVAELQKLLDGLSGKAPHGVVDEWLARPPREWAERARHLLLGESR